MGKRCLTGLCLAALLALSGCGENRRLQADARVEMEDQIHYVALTFDDGPRMGTTDRLLDGLKQRGASATFFLVGEQIGAHRELVERMKAEGHQIGNHTWSHQRLEGAEEETVREEIRRTEALLQQILGGEGYWLRPPYGQVDEAYVADIDVPMVKWSVDPRDWESRKKEPVKEAILSAVKPNSIILLHDIYPSSVEAALEVIDVLQGKNYEFVTVEELLAINGVVPQPGGMYRTGSGT